MVWWYGTGAQCLQTTSVCPGMRWWCVVLSSVMLSVLLFKSDEAVAHSLHKDAKLFWNVFFSLFMYSPASVFQEVTWFLATIPFTTHTGQVRFNAMVQSTRSISVCPHSTNVTGSNHFMDAAITCRPTLEGRYRSLCLLYSLHLLL